MYHFLQSSLFILNFFSNYVRMYNKNQHGAAYDGLMTPNTGMINVTQ